MEKQQTHHKLYKNEIKKGYNIPKGIIGRKSVYKRIIWNNAKVSCFLCYNPVFFQHA